eukprot:1901577-Pyramimonas_sp.AAC.1
MRRGQPEFAAARALSFLAFPRSQQASLWTCSATCDLRARAVCSVLMEAGRVDRRRHPRPRVALALARRALARARAARYTELFRCVGTRCTKGTHTIGN